jgi:hypothetical protein
VADIATVWKRASWGLSEDESCSRRRVWQNTNSIVPSPRGKENEARREKELTLEGEKEENADHEIGGYCQRGRRTESGLFEKIASFTFETPCLGHVRSD